jgi:hypothetical protein
MSRDIHLVFAQCALTEDPRAKLRCDTKDAIPFVTGVVWFCGPGGPIRLTRRRIRHAVCSDRYCPVRSKEYGRGQEDQLAAEEDMMYAVPQEYIWLCRHHL